MSSIVCDSIGKIYEDGTRAVGDVSLSIESGEFLVLVGPSGCGKSTILRMIAGLEDISEGTISINDRVVNDVQAKDRDIAMVFQNYALYPHMSIFDNMAFGLKLRKLPKDQIKQRVREAAEVLEITNLLKRKPKTLSGGQRQRVAMGRAIVREPTAFLMDEPLSNLDAKLRVQMRSELGQLHRRLNTTTVYVTHDQVEAMTLGQRVAVLKPVSESSPNNLQQVAAGTELFNNPVNLFVASFIGSPAMNLAYCTLESDRGDVFVEFAEHRIRVDSRALGRHPGLENRMGDQLVMGIRPGDFVAVPSAAEHETVEVTVTLAEMLGSETFVHYSVNSRPVTTADIADLLDERGFDNSADDTQFTSRIDADVNVVPGDRIHLRMETHKMHFFDPASGVRVGL